MKTLIFLTTIILFFGCTQKPDYDLIIHNALVYDGTGSPAWLGDLAVVADTIAAMGDLSQQKGVVELDAKGSSLAPGFINMLSWANVSLLHDGRSMSDIKQGVTLEVMGEGRSMGPWSEEMVEEVAANQTDIKYDIKWRTLGQYLTYLEEKGVSTNIASFVGNGTVRQHVIGYENRAASEAEIVQMKDLVAEAMEEGAVGLSSSLLYAPSGSADTEELIALSQVAASYGGLYISHIRNEGDQLFESIAELIEIAEIAQIRAEVYHLKASGQKNWYKLDSVFQMIESARDRGLAITADMYTYPASSTGLHVQLPEWIRKNGIEEMIKSLKNTEIRARLLNEISFQHPPQNILLVGFKSQELRTYLGLRLSEVAELRGSTAEQTMIDLIVEDDSRIQVVYFSMSEENIDKKIQQPWMSFCSDAGSLAAEGIFLNQSTHPRAYGSFIRVLGEFARERNVISMEEGIRRLTSLPAGNLKIEKRGSLKIGNYADLVLFDPLAVQDKATFADPHQYAEGIAYVWVNGTMVLEKGAHTGATPGQFVKGPGYLEK
ncbi:MAG: N-acyl-D-amino-acid deacylase [Cyclobacteriaceae bacterium]|jgi:N-acyl-D-amino-acid deacylase